MKTEQQLLEGLFFESGNIVEKFNFLDSIQLIGQLYSSKEKGDWVGDYKGQAFDGITDTRGNSMYIRYNGNMQFNNHKATIPLRAVLSIIRPTNYPESFIYAFLEAFRASFISSEMTVSYDQEQIFKEETGLDIEKLRQEIVLFAVDFQVFFKVNGACISLNYQKENCC